MLMAPIPGVSQWSDGRPWKAEDARSNRATRTKCARSSTDKSGRLRIGGLWVRILPSAPDLHGSFSGKTVVSKTANRGSIPRPCANFSRLV